MPKIKKNLEYLSQIATEDDERLINAVPTVSPASMIRGEQIITGSQSLDNSL